MFTRIATVVAAAVLASIASAYAVVSDSIQKNTFFNSDYVQPYLIGGDLLRDPQAYWTWRHSPSLYIVPDWVLGALLQGLGHAAAPILNAAILAVAYALSAQSIGRSVGRVGAYGGLAFMAMLAAVWIAAVSFDRFEMAAWLMSHTLVAYVHTGAAAGALIAAALLLKLWTRWSWPLAGAMAVTLLLLVFSDTIMLAWFVGPALILCCFDVLLTRRLDRLWLALAVALPAGIATYAEMQLNPAKGLYLDVGSIGAMASMHAFVGHVVANVRAGDFLFAGMLLVLLCMVATGIAALWRSRKTGIDVPAALDVLLPGIAAAVILGPLALGLYSVEQHWRYMVLLPPLCLVWLSARPYTHWPAYFAVASALVIATPVALSYDGPSGELQDCLPSEAGLGGYWVAKRVIFGSDRRIHVVQVGGDGALYAFNYNEAWWTKHPGTGEPFRADFIIMEELDPVQIEARYGIPDRVFDCAGRDIWSYDEPIYGEGVPSSS